MPTGDTATIGAPSTSAASDLIGPPLDRVDGPAKVAGQARYPTDVDLPGLAYAALVRSTVAAGRIRAIDTRAAEAAPGVISVLTHRNAPRLERGPPALLGPQPPPPLQDDGILHHGQYVAMVTAETSEQAAAAARLVAVEYDAADHPLLDLDDPRASRADNPWGVDVERGDVAAAVRSAPVRLRRTYSTPDETNNPLGLFATVAAWDGDSVTLHDATQHPLGVQGAVAGAFGIEPDRVRVLVPFVGGGFGSGLRVWPHVVLAALAARTTGRPVKLALTRPQMFAGIGHRPATVQSLELAATSDGELLAIDYDAVSPAAMEDGVIYRLAPRAVSGYACPNVAAHAHQVHLNIPTPAHMRAPGTAEANFAIESAMDELAVELGIDPIELRLRNFADTQPASGKPWSSNALRECYALGAKRFGWSERTPESRSMRDGGDFVGYGMAGVTFDRYQPECDARATIHRDGSALVTSAATEIGTGTYTVMAQLAAELLGLDVERVRFDLGDTDMPAAPQAGGSGLTGSLGSAVREACLGLLRRLEELGPREPGESHAEVLARHGLDELSADGHSAPRTPDDVEPAGAFGARFVEVRVDPDIGRVRVARVVSVNDGGRILNRKTATSQIVGGTVGGIGMALLEETSTDLRDGRIVNANLGDYLVAVNADVPDIEALFVGERDPVSEIGTKGIGEIGLVGVAAAIANAVYHATGRRVRSLPITIEKLL